MKTLFLVLTIVTASTLLSGCGTNSACSNNAATSCCGGDAAGNWY